MLVGDKKRSNIWRISWGHLQQEHRDYQTKATTPLSGKIIGLEAAVATKEVRIVFDEGDDKVMKDKFDASE